MVPMVLMASVIAVLAGCASSTTVEDEPGALLTRQVTQSAHCGLTGPGLAYVQGADRLQALLELPAQNMAVQQLRQVDLTKEHLLFVTLGEKTTGGYSVSLVSSESNESVLHISVAVRTPAPGTMVTQAVTSPCVVVAVPATNWAEVRVSGVRDEDLVMKP